MVESESLQMLEQPETQVVHHPLTGIDLHLRAIGGHELVEELQQDAGDDDRHEQRDRAVARGRADPAGDRPWKGLPAEDVVDDDLERPRLQRAQADFEQQQDRQHGNAAAIRPQKRKRPANQSRLHQLGLLAGSSRFGGTRLGARRGMMSGTIWSLLESATYSHPR